MTEFNGLKNEDFDFWIHQNPHYVPILKRKIESLAREVQGKLPDNLRKRYSDIRPGNVSRKIKDDRFAWIAIKRPENTGVLNQCNFTLEIGKNFYQVNAIIRNGKTFQEKTPLGMFYKRLMMNPDRFLKIVSNLPGEIKKNVIVQFCKRLPKSGKRIMPGNEYWTMFFEMKMADITTTHDVQYLSEILKKADVVPASPGVRVGITIDRGDLILSDPNALIDLSVKAIIGLDPILMFLRD
jgi:hypothetical protein